MEEIRDRRRELRGGGGSGGGRGASSIGSGGSSDDAGGYVIEKEFRNITAEVEYWNEKYLDNMLIMQKLYEPVIGILIFLFLLYALSLCYMKY